MKKIMLVFGTRPEAIKMCPLINELNRRGSFQITVCVTGQHKEMLDQVLEAFGIVPDYDLALMKSRQTSFDLTIGILAKIKEILEFEKPDVLLVHGDTTTTFASALACFYLQIPVGHVEAGLRTYNIDSPFPEEFNRQAVGLFSKFHFVPTEFAKENLLKEGKADSQIFVTGNTVIDAMNLMVKDSFSHPILDWASDSKLVLLTVHRKENLGEPMKRIFNAVKKIIEQYEDVKIVYPVHLNPIIRSTAVEMFGFSDRILLTEPLPVLDFHNILIRSYLIMTDSGGIQEEAASAGIPTLILRETTERIEGIENGVFKLVGTEETSIFEAFTKQESNVESSNKNKSSRFLFGDGHASERIADILEKILS